MRTGLTIALGVVLVLIFLNFVHIRTNIYLKPIDKNISFYLGVN